MQIKCNFPNMSYLSETQKNNFQFLNEKKNEKYIKSELSFLLSFITFPKCVLVHIKIKGEVGAVKLV